MQATDQSLNLREASPAAKKKVVHKLPRRKLSDSRQIVMCFASERVVLKIVEQAQLNFDDDESNKNLYSRQKSIRDKQFKNISSEEEIKARVDGDKNEKKYSSM
jgi:hypothetical protein